MPVHVGLFKPGTPRAEYQAQRDPLSSALTLQERSPLTASPGIDWAALEMQPRWVYEDSSDCAAALEPNAYHNHGLDELERFFAGARIRQETAVLVSTVGNATDDRLPPPFAAHDSTLVLPLDLGVTVGGKRLQTGTRARLADGLDPVDKDLGTRLLNPAPDLWWALGMHALKLGAPGRGGAETYTAVPMTGGALRPILVDGLGDPVAAVWVPAGTNLRWYFLPDTVDWDTVIRWLVQKALPAFAPDALRRARPATFADPDLETGAETRAREDLERLEQRYADDKQTLQEQLRHAREHADPVREGLLYGTAQQVVDAVARVLQDAGFSVTDLDRELAATKSADLLVALGGQSRLIEVKSQGGDAAEKLVSDLQRHLSTWPELRPEHPVDGGALIVNHQLRRLPRDRDAAVYRRKEFVATLPFPVLASRQLFGWWRASDWDSIRQAILGAPPSPPTAPDEAAVAAVSAREKRRWRR